MMPTYDDFDADDEYDDTSYVEQDHPFEGLEICLPGQTKPLTLKSTVQIDPKPLKVLTQAYLNKNPDLTGQSRENIFEVDPEEKSPPVEKIDVDRYQIPDTDLEHAKDWQAFGKLIFEALKLLFEMPNEIGKKTVSDYRIYPIILRNAEIDKMHEYQKKAEEASANRDEEQAQKFAEKAKECHNRAEKYLLQSDSRKDRMQHEWATRYFVTKLDQWANNQIIARAQQRHQSATRAASNTPLEGANPSLPPQNSQQLASVAQQNLDKGTALQQTGETLPTPEGSSPGAPITPRYDKACEEGSIQDVSPIRPEPLNPDDSHTRRPSLRQN